MGYTHYFRTQKEIELPIMESIVNDFKKAVGVLSPYVDLAGGDGEGNPIITYNKICFNGRSNCGHTKTDFGIPWPTDDAGGVITNPFKENIKEKTWFAGVMLRGRVCDGDCSHETMLLERIKVVGLYTNPENGFYFGYCKTAFKPYDLAVITLLIIAKHYLKEKIKVSSDGTNEQWFDGKMLCQKEFGYGLDFKLR